MGDPSHEFWRRLPQQVLHSLGEGVSLADSEGHIVFSNEAADRILGVGATDAPPATWAEYYGVFLPEDRTTPFPTEQYPLVRALRGETTRDVEMWIRNPGVPAGALIAVTGQPLKDDAGAIVGAAVVFRDITALRRARDELERTNSQLRETQRQKDELAAFLVHDLKNPITTIMLSAGLVMGSPGIGQEDREALGEIHESAESLHRMVLDLLDVRLAEDGRLQPRRTPVNATELLADVGKALRGQFASSGTDLEVTDAGQDVIVSGDPELLQRVVHNLLANCLKYAPGGTVRMAARPLAGSVQRITVEDDGPGVPPGLRDRIFEMWAKSERDEGERHRHSRGVGLYFCRLVTQAHGGRIWVEDSDLGGARFCIELPGA